jgi:hypothetical protein
MQYMAAEPIVRAVEQAYAFVSLSALLDDYQHGVENWR